MRFTNPGWLLGGLAACLLLAWMWYRYDARQYKSLALFVSANLRHQLTRSLSVGKRRVQRGSFLVAVALLFCALAGPQLGYRWEKINRRGNEIVFAIDTSRSMSTPDIKPDRLTRAKLAIDDFTKRLGGDAVGIVAFAGAAFLVCPITLDYGAFHESLEAVDTNTIPRGGTNISSAIHEAQAALRRRPGSDRIMILVTDGEDLEGSAVDAATAANRDDGLKIYTVGVGSAGGELIPLPPNQGGGFVKDDAGEFVKSRLDEAGLKAIAAATGGFYVPLGIQGEGLDTIFNSVLGTLAKHDLASRQQKIYTERYQWPLAAALATLLFSLLIGTRRRRLPAMHDAATRIALGLFSVLTLPALTPPAANAASAARAADAPHPPAVPPSALSAAAAPPEPGAPGNRGDATASTRATTAAATPGDSKKPLVEFNAGTSAYRAGRFPQAAQAFQQSISHAPSGDAKRLADQEDAYYNLGNTLYRTGQRTEKSAPKDTIEQWTHAVSAYETALQLRPNDADSKYNRDLVKRKIDALKQQQDQDKNKNKDQGKGGGQGQGNGQGASQGQSQAQNKDPAQSQPPPQGQPGQPPPGQPPGQPGQQPPQTANNGEQKPAQASPPQPDPGAAKPDQPPPRAGQSPGAPGPSPPQNPGQPPADQAPDQQSDAAARAADNEHLPGQMSREEARELLDSVKGDEKHALGAPLARRDDDNTPDKPPSKNW